MAKTRILLFFLVFQCVLMAHAQKVEYLDIDKKFITELLAKAKTERGDMPRTYYFGRKFLGLPYVAHTLENGDTEHLIVNTRELDCTTFVETVAALSLCDANDKRTFDDFCRALKMLRYRNGEIKNYTSRLHYFTQWGEDNERMGLVKSVFETVPKDKFNFATQTVNVNYMSTYPSKYKQLKNHPEFVKPIRNYEKEINGKKYPYLPKSKLGMSQKQLGFIKTGDIVSLITSKDGLDTSHIGIAVWIDGKLHLMHASSLYKKVVVDSKTFYDYSQAQPSQLGIRVYRLNENPLN